MTRTRSALLELKTAALRFTMARRKYGNLVEKSVPIGTKVLFPLEGEFVRGEIVDHQSSLESRVGVMSEQGLVFQVNIDDLDLV